MSHYAEFAAYVIVYGFALFGVVVLVRNLLPFKIESDGYDNPLDGSEP